MICSVLQSCRVWDQHCEALSNINYGPYWQVNRFTPAADPIRADPSRFQQPVRAALGLTSHYPASASRLNSQLQNKQCRGNSGNRCENTSQSHVRFRQSWGELMIKKVRIKSNPGSPLLRGVYFTPSQH